MVDFNKIRTLVEAFLYRWGSCGAYEWIISGTGPVDDRRFCFPRDKVQDRVKYEWFYWY